MTATIWERVQTALTPLAVPMAAGMYLAATAADLPDLYLVYFLVLNTPEEHADDVEKLRSNRVQVSVYSRKGLAHASVPNVGAAMVAAGFMAGNKTEIPYNQATRHFGLSLEFFDTEES